MARPAAIQFPPDMIGGMVLVDVLDVLDVLLDVLLVLDVDEVELVVDVLLVLLVDEVEDVEDVELVLDVDEVLEVVEVLLVLEVEVVVVGCGVRVGLPVVDGPFSFAAGTYRTSLVAGLYTWPMLISVRSVAPPFVGPSQYVSPVTLLGQSAVLKRSWRPRMSKEPCCKMALDNDPAATSALSFIASCSRCIATNTVMCIGVYSSVVATLWNSRSSGDAAYASSRVSVHFGKLVMVSSRFRTFSDALEKALDSAA
eukprot:gene10794-biopygen7715